MPTTLNGIIYYRTAEACQIAGVSRNTFLRWVREGSYADVEHRDRNSWRLFTENDVAKLKGMVNKINKNPAAQKHEGSSQV